MNSSSHKTKRFVHTRYCAAVVEWEEPVDTPDGYIVESQARMVEFDNFQDVFSHLKFIREDHLIQIADAIAYERLLSSEYTKLGGFTCELHNRFGGIIEFALAEEYALMIRIEPQPSTFYSNGPASNDTLVFFIDGGHHTEFHLSELATRDDALEQLEHWINTGEFPNSVS